jgi:hypothetical protein
MVGQQIGAKMVYCILQDKTNKRLLGREYDPIHTRLENEVSNSRPGSCDWPRQSGDTTILQQ